MSDFDGVWNAMDYGTEPLPIAFVHEIAKYFWDAAQRSGMKLVAVPAVTTPDATLLPLVPDERRRKMLIEIEVSANFEKRLDNQWEVEREINADRWSWTWAKREDGSDWTRP